MDKALKQRLVGAGVIIALAVIILPMLLSGRPEGAGPDSQKIELPPRPNELAFETRRFPISGQDQEAGAGAADMTGDSRAPAVAGQINRGVGPAIEVPDAASSETVAPPAESVADLSESDAADRPLAESSGAGATPAAGSEGDAPPLAPPATAISTPAASADRYVVQVASLGSAENARRLMTSLQQQGFTALLDVVESDVGRLNRVRVGPYASEAEAAQASVRIGKEFDGVSPRVVDLHPEQYSAVTRPVDPLVRWVVQVGSFSEESNAIRLVKQLQDDKQSAYRESVTSGGSLIYRVRVGPFLEREEALLTRQQLSERMAIDGVVMSAD